MQRNCLQFLLLFPLVPSSLVRQFSMVPAAPPPSNVMLPRNAPGNERECSLTAAVNQQRTTNRKRDQNRKQRTRILPAKCPAHMRLASPTRPPQSCHNPAQHDQASHEPCPHQATAWCAAAAETQRRGDGRREEIGSQAELRSRKLCHIPE